MRLADALRLAPGRVVAFTGAGGKTAAIGRLVRELTVEGRVVVTTTTKIHRDQSSLAEYHLIAPDPSALSNLAPLLEAHCSVLVTGEASADEPKWLGINTSTMDVLYTITQREGCPLLIEADGARGRSLKAPAEHEPHIPPCADLIVPVVGLDAVGEPLDDDRVHRSERVASILGLAHGERLTVEHIVDLVRHPVGGLKGVPQGAEVRVLLNKAEITDRLKLGRKIADALMTELRLQAVVIACVREEPPVREVVGRVAGIVMAAGDSKRLGHPKQLITWRGRTLVGQAVHAAVNGGLSPVVVVLGAEAERIRTVLAEESVILVENPIWIEGLSTSLKTGLSAIEKNSEAVVLLLCDTPFVDAALIKALVQKYRSTLSPLVAPRAGGRRANPVLFDRTTFSALHAVQGNQGGRVLFKQFPKTWIEWDESILFDLDTPEDLQRLKELE